MLMKNLVLPILVTSLSSFFLTYYIDYTINHVAFAQDYGASSGPVPQDNMTNGNNGTDTGPGPIPQDNSTGIDSINNGNPPDLGLPADNMSTYGTMTTSGNNTVPEFGSIAILVLVISIISIVVISSKSRLGF
jgi:predicted secreted protein with PEFG-CTERM motif